MTEVVSPNKKSLKRMGALTGLAIGLHNVPEGLATFVATLSSPAFGGALALAIALHNIPEGVCVAVPVYYATGSRVRGFLWAFLSGVSEPLGSCCVCVCVCVCVKLLLKLLCRCVVGHGMFMHDSIAKGVGGVHFCSVQ